MTRRRTKTARGFGLVVMLVAIALLGVFAVVSTRLIKTTLDLYRDAGRIDGEARMMDSALSRLRQDVWSARQVTTAGPQAITIGRAAGPAVNWHVDPDGTLVRTEAGDRAGEAPRRWPEIGARVSFDWDGVALIVRGADCGADRVGGVRMISQLKLAEAGGRR